MPTERTHFSIQVVNEGFVVVDEDGIVMHTGVHPTIESALATQRALASLDRAEMALRVPRDYY